MQRDKVPMGPSVLGVQGGEGEGEEGTGGMARAHTGREESLVGPGEHSEPFIQHEAGEESGLCAAAEWPHAAAQTHPCGCERALSAEPQTCWTHLEQSRGQRSKVNTPALDCI